ncbi:MAG TPA: class I SAM-dependent methyltransferase [Acidobacteriaceae bacterium]|jgi:SAM-dependent methyltransferase
MTDSTAAWTVPDYGIDAPGVMRNLLVFGGLALVLSFAIPASLHAGPVELNLRVPLRWIAGFLLVQGLMFLLYVKHGKFRHRDFMLALYPWRGNERVLDVGCGRGLLLAGIAKRLTTGSASGLDIWSNEDMAGNSEKATLRNLELEGVIQRCALVSEPAQAMTFDDASFDVVVSNLCLHNIYDKTLRRQALQEIVRVLKPGGVALISDYKRTGEYIREFKKAGLKVQRLRGSLFATFPPLKVVIASKPPIMAG